MDRRRDEPCDVLTDLRPTDYTLTELRDRARERARDPVT
jgi:hypothetical protein